MPRVARARAARVETLPPTIIADDYVEELAGDAIQQSEEGRFDPIKSSSVGFFDAVRKISSPDWDRYIVYVYRVEPSVRNNVGEPAFISKHVQAIDEEDIRELHGGGKYKLILKDVRRDSSRTHMLRVEGQPKLIAGQTLVKPEVEPQPAAVASAAAPQRSDTAEIIQALREFVQQPPGGASQVELIMQAAKSSIDVVKQAAAETARSATGSAMSDKVIETLLLRAVDNKPASDPLKEKLIDFALERLGNPTPEPSVDPLKGLGIVKDLLGVDNLGDLVSLAGGSGKTDWKADLIKVVAPLAANIPAILQFMATRSEQNFRQALAIAQMRRSGRAGGDSPGLTGAPPVAATPIAPAVPITTAVQPTPGVEMFQPNPFLNAMDDIVVFFEEGDEGEGAARFIFRKYQEIVSSPMIKPYLADAGKLGELAKQTPPLNQVASDPEFPAFVKNFVDGLNQCFTEYEAEGSSGPEASSPANPTSA